ncbi:MAG: radical SAM protein [Nanoarchaeota archaeon]
MAKKTQRVKVHSNYSCNLKCRFCYYGDSKCIKEKDPSFEDLKKQLDIAKSMGALDVDFSGGEPTIRKDFPELVAYTKSKGFRTICVITNGLRMANKEYVKKVIDSGLNDILFSLEGYNSKTHDYLTRVPGSFEKINKAIKNAKELGVRVRINITVTKENYKYLENFARHILKFNPDAVNFIKFNPWDVALHEARGMSPKYSEIAPHLKKAIDILKPRIVKITVRYIPYCFMQGYEKHVCNCMHNQFDSDEWWIPKIQYRMETKAVINIRGPLKRILKNLPFIIRLEPSYFMSFDKFVLGIQLKKLYTKPNQCRKCKYFYVCDGIDKPYPKIYGAKEIIPVTGVKIKEPMFAREKYLENYNEKFGF